MSTTNTHLLYALDFDGVICDSAVETGMAGWKAACQIWPDMPQAAADETIAQFRRVRPIIETGYEAILAMRLLHTGLDCDALYAGYDQHIQTLLSQTSLGIAELKQRFGATRDAWIAAEPEQWAAMNPLFAGVADKLRRLPRDMPWYIVTTKQERFVARICQANAIEIDDERIFGLDRKLSKPDVLRLLKARHPSQIIQFVEDRLPALQTVRQQADLADIALLFASWGYNTPQDKADAVRQGFTSLALNDFLS
ncbi:MAG: HAD family hydrolase [Methylomonas sp.]|nr:HAD family hydrolase [Methylomonas sp.]PPD19827.1 MAG: hypothetical protein CTY23_10615 [Methylomonas sp.]PPD26662.1 MAG: hypothetical protein CTY22_04440 [Methylomonas sp.]PPD37321.1 MAG: hypothetical protein CTY17_10740 [Methylomonas sp.]PPD38470.1 MAG: hypothetical protein CTY21_04440 [Methylomonas sp.]